MLIEIYNSTLAKLRPDDLANGRTPWMFLGKLPFESPLMQPLCGASVEVAVAIEQRRVTELKPSQGNYAGGGRQYRGEDVDVSALIHGFRWKR